MIPVTVSIICLFFSPWLAGKFILRLQGSRRLSWAITYLIGMLSAGVVLVTSNALYLGCKTAYGLVVVITLAGLCLCFTEHASQKSSSRSAWRSRAALAAAPFYLIIVLVVFGSLLHTLADPIAAWDAVAIWFHKAKAFYYWEDFRSMPFPQYPGLWPAVWSLTLKGFGPNSEMVGRFLISLSFILFVLGAWHVERQFSGWGCGGFSSLALCVLFFDVESFTNGYQDALLFSCSALTAFLLMAALRCQAAGTAQFARLERELAGTGLLICGLLGWIKNEGLVLGVLQAGWYFTISAALILLNIKRNGKKSFGIRRLLTGRKVRLFVLFAVLAAGWPLLQRLNGFDPSRVQGESFYWQDIFLLSDRLARWPRIAEAFQNFLEPRASLMALALASIIILAAYARALPAAIWAAAAYGSHLAFIGLVYLMTRADLEWHLATSFDRLMLISMSVPAAVLFSGIAAGWNNLFFRSAEIS